jgi:hypothetical protein
MMTISSTSGISPSRSPEPLHEGRTSTAPNTPTQAPLTGAEDSLSSRVSAVVDAAAGVARRVGLPVLAAVRDASVTQALGAVVRDAVAPATSLAVNVVSTLAKASQQFSQAVASSQPLQTALSANLENPNAQMGAHLEAVEYGKHSAEVLDRVLPFLHSAARIGVAGTSLAFGLGRSAGLAAGDAIGRVERGVPQNRDVISGDMPQAATLSSTSTAKLAAVGVQQWLLGSLTGAVGNLAGQFVAGPVLNLIPRQFQPIDARAVVPQETVDLMNTLKPGAGNELRDQVKAAQGEIANIASPSNVLLGQISFDAVTAGRFAGQSGTPLGVAGQVGFGLAVSATAGTMIGAAMAVRQSVATVKVPDIAGLREAVAASPADGAAALANVASKEVPLFFAKHTATGGSATVMDAAQRSTAAQIRDSVLQVASGVVNFPQAAGAAVKQAFVAGPLLDPLPTAQGAQGSGTAGRALATASNVAGSGLRRFLQMAKSTAMTTGMSTASAMLASATEGPARRAVLAVGNAVGIHAAIKPWFNALVRDIPAGDNAMKAQRQETVNKPAATDRPRV